MSSSKIPALTQTTSPSETLTETPCEALTEAQVAQILWETSRLLRAIETPESLGQQVIERLGQALKLDQAALYPYEPGEAVLSPLVEQVAPGYRSTFTSELNFRENPELQVLLQPPHQAVFEEQDGGSVLAVTIHHLGQIYGLLLLARRGPNSGQDWRSLWLPLEQTLVEEMAAQLGQAIAHVALQSENQALRHKLHRVRDGFIQKHQQLEDQHQQLEDQHQQLEEARAQAELAYEKAREASRLKSEFLANTSHELRTPLNGMIGFLKLVLDGMADTPEELNEFVGEAHNSALLLLNIINDILDVAKIEAGKMDLDLTAVPLGELFEEVARKTKQLASDRNLLYKIERPPTHDEVVVYGDYQRILQVMLNLVGNAIKFTEYGSVTVSTRIIQKPVVINQSELPGLVEVRVVDTGIGVSLEKQAKLFKSFSQVDGSRTRQYGGTGLGLVISQKLVEAMGGEVHFYSMGEDLGSTVTFTVPLYQKPVVMRIAPEES